MTGSLVIASEAKQSSLPGKQKGWIASSQVLLAMTAFRKQVSRQG